VGADAMASPATGQDEPGDVAAEIAYQLPMIMGK
jgi:hypothetical protein